MNTSSLFHNPVLNFIKEVFLQRKCVMERLASGGAAIDIP